MEGHQVPSDIRRRSAWGGGEKYNAICEHNIQIWGFSAPHAVTGSDGVPDRHARKTPPLLYMIHCSIP